MTGDRLLRACGADPAVFRPVARAQAIVLRRRARLAQNARGTFGKASPFRILVGLACLYGFFGLAFVMRSPSPLLGAVLPLLLGSAFLLMVVVTDDLDALINPREYLVLAAHPHDDRSMLLAKLFVIGRSLSVLWLCLFVPPVLALIGKTGSIPAGLAFAAGAAGLAIAASAAAILLGAAVLVAGGLKAIDRLLPWFQVAFQLGYFLFLGGQWLVGLMQARSLPSGILWAVPLFWFLAPLEAVLDGPTLPVVGRGLVAAAVLGGLLAGGARLLGSHVGQRLLEPREQAPPRKIRARRAGSGLGWLFRSPENRRLFSLLLVHLRVDWRIRSEFLMMPVIGLALLFQAAVGPQKNFIAPSVMIGFLGWFLMLAVDVLTRSSRPSALWIILVSPVDRARLSAAAISVVRVFQLVPLGALVISIEIFRGSGPWTARLLSIAELLLFGDLLILVGRGLFSDFPFSRPSRSAGEMGGRRMVVMLTGGFFSGVGTLALWLLGLAGMLGAAAACVLLIAARWPASIWMRGRVWRAAEALELASGDAG